jgi:hypothetical protein
MDMIIQRLLHLLFLFIIFHQPLYAQPLGIVRTEDVSVHYEESMKGAAFSTLELYPDLKVELEETFGWALNFRPKILLIKNSINFRRITNKPYIVALALPQENLIVIHYSKMNQHPFSLGITLKHEMCHLMIHHHIDSHQLPKWFDEGIAQWISDGIAELIMTPKRALLNDTILAGNYLSLRELSDRFPQERRSLQLAYEESKSMVEYIVLKYGENGILNILDHLKNGLDFETAVKKSLSLSINELEIRWHNHLKKRENIFVFLAGYIYEVLFFVGALLTIAAFIRFLLKKRAYTDEDDEMRL